MSLDTLPPGCISCLHCKRTVRPYEAKIADFPGTVRKGARGLCQTCHVNPAIREEYDLQVWPGVDLINEVEMMLRSGRAAREIPAALGRTPQALSTACYRNGRDDLGRVFGRLIDRSQDNARRTERRRAAREADKLGLVLTA